MSKLPYANSKANPIQALARIDISGADYLRGWAYGVYILWNSMTMGWQKEEDGQRLEAMTEEKI